MSELFAIHPDNPQARLLRKAAIIIADGGLVVYPTDSGYAFGCALNNKNALDRIRKLRHLDSSHNLSMVCRDLSKLSHYAKVTTPIFRLLRAFTPGSYTFILNATKEVPKLMRHPHRKTLGLRVPDHLIAWSLLECLNAPLMSSTLILPGVSSPLSEPEAFQDLLGNQVDLIIDGGSVAHEPTTVIDLTADYPVILREGRGDSSAFR